MLLLEMNSLGNLEEVAMRYRKKPIVIEAIQWRGFNVQAICDFVVGGTAVIVEKPEEPMKNWKYNFGKETLEIPTLEGNHLAKSGDWIIKGIAGEFYPCKPDIFEKTYEKA